jgi:type I restriction enzyme S subunit
MKQGWEIKKLGEVCDLQNGYAFKSGDYVEFSNTINFRMSQIRPGGGVDLENNPKYLPDEFAITYKDYLLKEGDIVIAMTDMATETKILGVPTIVPSDSRNWLLNQRVGKLFNIDKSKVNIAFLKYILVSEPINDYYKKLGRGGLQINIGKQDILNAKIPLPPLPEQQRIVSILDECFAAIDKAKANAEKNLRNAKELFESYLHGVFEGEGWEEKTIQEITKVVNGYAFASKEFKPTNSIKSVKITNVGVREFVEATDNYLPEKFKETLKEFQVREGNIVIALTRTIISAGLKVAVVPASYDSALVNQRVAALVPNEKLVNQNFLYFYLTTSGVAKYVLEHVNTLMQPNLSINDLKNMPVPCPPLKQQQTIVRQLDALRSETQKLEAVYQKKIDDLEELKKSILQKAFTGELGSPEGAKYDCEAATPLAKKKTSSIKSPEGVE